MNYELETVITFGKYKGKTLKHVIDNDVLYAKWFEKEAYNVNFSDDAYRYLLERDEFFLDDYYQDDLDDHSWSDGYSHYMYGDSD